MRARRVGVCPGYPASSLLQTLLHYTKDLFNSGHSGLCQANNVDLLLAIFSAVQEDALVEQVVKFAAVNLVKAHLEIVVGEVAQETDDVEGGKLVETGHRAIVDAHHGEGFAGAGLSVGKAGRVGPFEGAPD